MKEAVIKEIERLEFVKDVNVDSGYKRSPLQEGQRKVGAFVDGRKQPGKIFTSMSFSDVDEEYRTPISNASINWGRHLLMQARL